MGFIPNLFNRFFNKSLPKVVSTLVYSDVTGPVYTVGRLLSSSSTFSLITGTDGNLTINTSTGVISAAAVITANSNQVAIVREVDGLSAVEYPVTVNSVANPTPATPSNIATPVITPTSTPGVAPFSWKVVNDISYVAGYFWHVQRASTPDNLIAGALTGDVIRQITPQDIASGEMTFTGLSSQTDGTLAIRIRVGRDNGLGGYIWSDWSNVLTDTISSLPASVKFSQTQRRTSGSVATVYNNDLSVRTAELSNAAATAALTAFKTAGSPVNNRAYVEYFMETTTGTAGARDIGFMVSDFVPNSAQPGAASQPGIRYNSNGVIIYSSNTQMTANVLAFTDGDVIGAYCNVDIGRAWFSKNGGWLVATGDPNLYCAGVVINSTQGNTSITVTTAPTSGAPIQVGTRLYRSNNNAFIGVVQSLGTGTGGTGTYILAVGAPSTENGLSCHGGGLPLNITGSVVGTAAPYRNNPITVRPEAATQQYRGSLQPYGM